MNLKAKIKELNIILLIIGVVLGGTAGFLYYYFIGCSQGTCPITSNPYISVLYGVLAGAVLTFKKKKKTLNPESNQEN
ncbi:MAG: hypothetical protein Kow0068_22520 [Marinilabiliales bacterium]